MKNKIIIIAEAGVNHNGNFELAKKLIKKAADAGADYIKFQTFKAEKLVNQTALKAEYQIKNFVDSDQTQYSMLKKLEMSEKWHYDLIEYANKCKIKFLSTGFDEDSVDLLDSLNVDLFKIPSGELTNKMLLQHIAKKGKDIILSTGMAYLDEVKAALNVLNVSGIKNEQITVLHCNTEYPTPYKDVNLLAMKSLENELGVKIGYSDHTQGIEISIAAASLGAKVIEKHFTLNRNLPGPDHFASLNPSELKKLVNSIRNIELALSGDGIKVPSESEKKNIISSRKSIHVLNKIKSGEKIKIENLIMKRPGDGISPMLIDDVIGSIALNDLNTDYKLTWRDITIK